jgi:hypothetical protein
VVAKRRNHTAHKFTYIPGKKAACWRFWAHENLHSESPGIRFAFKCTNHMHLNLIQTLVILGRKGNGTLKDDVYHFGILTIHNICFIL